MLYRENAACVVKQQEQIQAPQLYLIANHVQGAYYEDIYKAVLQEQYENNIEKYKKK